MPATKTPPNHNLSAVLGPTNTGKTHLAVERMLGHASGMIGLPLRLLAREVYDKVVNIKGKSRAALITGEERIVPDNAAYFICTTEAMPLTTPVSFLAVDEVQLAGDHERGHIFTNRLLHARGLEETMLLGAATILPIIRSLLPDARVINRPRFSELSYVSPKKIARLPKRTAVIAFTMEGVYRAAELLRRNYGGAAVVMGALSPKTRNAQVELYQDRTVDYIVATDAIGMGLNMDIDHVVFAEVEKFDGTRRRKLFPHELAQIAGRAGRHLNSGTFTTLAEIEGEGLSPEDIRKIENHSFAPLKRLEWRNAALNFKTPLALIKSLEEAPANPLLSPAREALDLRALKTLVARGVEANTPEMVQTLWTVCQIPDFLGFSENHHFSLLQTLFGFLSSASGKIPHEWMARRVAELDNFQGGTETLMQRIARIRTWTYISHRAGWLEETDHWAYTTRRLEDKLSGALHERLQQRFVDKRTTALVSNIKGKHVMTKVDSEGLVTIEGQPLGALKGFCFQPARGLEGEDAKAHLKEAEKGLRPVIAARAEEFTGAGNADIILELSNSSGRARILWRGDVIAHLVKGQGILRPEVQLAGNPLLEDQDLKAVKGRLKAWFEAEMEAHLGPLLTLSEAAASHQADLPGLTRGMAYKMVENLGVSAKAFVLDDLKTLKPEDRKALHKVGFWFGAHFVYLPRLLKPAPTKWRLALWGIWEEIKGWPEMPEAGVMWAETLKGTPRGFYQTLGYRPAGSKAVRIDCLERLFDAVRPLGIKNKFFAVTPEIMGLVGLSGEDFANVMKFLGYYYKKELPGAKQGEEAKPKYSFKWDLKKTAAKKVQRPGKQKLEERKIEESPFAELKHLKFSSGKS